MRTFSIHENNSCVSKKSIKKASQAFGGGELTSITEVTRSS
jgi:hypothetical protein